MSSTRNAGGFCVVESSGCDLETPLAPEVWWSVELGMVARWNLLWEMAAIGAYRTGVRGGISWSSAEGRWGCSGEWEMRLNDLHCTGLRQDDKDLPRDMEPIQSFQDGIKQGSGKSQQRQEQSWQKVRT